VLPGSPGDAARPRYACDVATIRYAPNARLLADAARHAGPGRHGTALVAAAGRPRSLPAAPPLPLAEAEAAAVRTRLSAERCHSPEPATLEAVLRALPVTDVWHLACHGRADAAEPLDSAVYLEDLPLRLRHLLGRPTGRHRLAVLSACQTNVPDPERLDEVIAFPGALMRAGVSGVVATQWHAGDSAAVLLVDRFYAGWLAGMTPPDSLAAAQRWLREATLAELTRLLPRRSGRSGPRPGVPAEGERPQGRWATRPYADKPWIWAPFTYTGA
jgi:CHAT domain-containing protein